MTRLHCPVHGPMPGRRCAGCAAARELVFENRRRRRDGRDLLRESWAEPAASAAPSDGRSRGWLPLPLAPGDDGLDHYRASLRLLATAREIAGDRLPTPIDPRRIQTSAMQEEGAR